MSSQSKRIYFVDFARSFAIVLALTDHSMNDFEVWFNYPLNTYTVLKTFTSSATPTFIFLFGMMLEIIYLRKLQKHGIRRVASQLINRSFQCYLGYFLTVIAGFAGGLLLFKNVVSATFFLGNCHFGNILKLYTLMLLVAIPLVWFRQKYGILKTVLLGFSPWIIYPLYQFVPPLQPNIAIFTSHFFGIGGAGGPSVLMSLSLVVVGMLVASFISFEKEYSFQWKTCIILGLLMVSMIGVFFKIPFEEFRHKHITNMYRNANHPVYYLLSSCLALIVALVSSWIIPIGSKIKKGTYTFLAFGRSSLTAFTAGNIILNLVAIELWKHKWNILAPVTFVIVIFLILQFYEKIYPNLLWVKKITELFRGVRIQFQWHYVRRLSNIFGKYLSNA